VADGFSVTLDTPSLGRLARLEGFKALMEPEVVAMLAATGVMLVTAAQINTWEVFDNPTGKLASTIAFEVVSPEEIALTVGVPYGRRREKGGGGGLDAIGRPMNDRARPYLQPAIDDNQDLILAIMEEHTLLALGGVA